LNNELFVKTTENISGKVKFENISVEKRDASYYKEVKEADKIIENGTIAEAIAVLQ
jgi:hypothetical protein